jgi:hypothetical protein
MSAANPPDLDLREQIARIDRAIAESEKFTAEQRKLRAEDMKLAAEQHKLMREAEKYRAEEMKLWRDWRLAPWIIIASLVASLIGGIVARFIH